MEDFGKTHNKAKEAEILNKKIREEIGRQLTRVIEKLKNELKNDMENYIHKTLNTEEVLKKYDFNVAQFNRLNKNIKLATNLFEKMNDNEKAVNALLGNT